MKSVIVERLSKKSVWVKFLSSLGLKVTNLSSSADESTLIGSVSSPRDSNLYREWDPASEAAKAYPCFIITNAEQGKIESKYWQVIFVTWSLVDSRIIL